MSTSQITSKDAHNVVDALVEVLVPAIGSVLSMDQIFDDERIKTYAHDAFQPEDIFEDHELKAWAQDRLPEDIFEQDSLAGWAAEQDLDDILEEGKLNDWIKNNREPEDIYSEDELRDALERMS